MTDAPTPEANSAEDFRSQVQRLVTEGKITAEEAAGLLEDTEPAHPHGAGLQANESAIAHYVKAVQEGDFAPNLLLKVKGYGLSVITDPAVSSPQLSANRDGELSLSVTPQGLTVERLRKADGQWDALKAILTLPFVPQQVNAQINGGNLNLPDVSGEVRADVNGGNIRMGGAASLWADINGGNLTAEDIDGPTHISVNGGNITLTGATALNASVNGGNLKWAGQLAHGEHRVEVNGGNATLQLHPGSSLRVHADVTVGSFKADFPTQKQGSFVTTRHSGQLGGGAALLSCKVAAGQMKLVTE